MIDPLSTEEATTADRLDDERAVEQANAEYEILISGPEYKNFERNALETMHKNGTAGTAPRPERYDYGRAGASGFSPEPDGEGNVYLPNDYHQPGSVISSGRDMATNERIMKTGGDEIWDAERRIREDYNRREMSFLEWSGGVLQGEIDTEGAMSVVQQTARITADAALGFFESINKLGEALTGGYVDLPDVPEVAQMGPWEGMASAVSEFMMSYGLAGAALPQRATAAMSTLETELIKDSIATFVMDPSEGNLVSLLHSFGVVDDSELFAYLDAEKLAEDYPLGARFAAVGTDALPIAALYSLFGKLRQITPELREVAEAYLEQVKVGADLLIDDGVSKQREGLTVLNAGTPVKAAEGMAEEAIGRTVRAVAGMAERMGKNARGLVADAAGEQLKGISKDAWVRQKVNSGFQEQEASEAWDLALSLRESVSGQITDSAKARIKAREKARRAELRQYKKDLKLPNVRRLIEKYPEAEPILRHMTSEERINVTWQHGEQLLRVWNMLDPEEMADVALAGMAKRGWYEYSARALLNVFGPADAPRFTALLAATSPQTSVESNLKNSLNIWKNWDAAGRPTDRESIKRIMGQSVEGEKGEGSVLGAWLPNTVRALSTSDLSKLTLSGPKVNSFMRNLNGELQEVTNDTWMARFAGVSQDLFGGSINVAGTQPGKKGGYLGMSALTRAAADRLTKVTGEKWEPAEIQETVWSWAKALMETRESLGYTGEIAEKIIQRGGLTDDIINAVPDFRLLLQDPEYADILRSAGYGQRIDELAGAGTDEQIRAAGESGRGYQPKPRNLKSAARRIERAYAKKVIGKVTEEARKEIPLQELGRFSVSGPYRRGARRSRRHILGNAAWRHTPDAEYKARLTNLGYAAPEVYQIEGDKAAESFHKAITDARNRTDYGASVYVYPKEDYADMRLFVTEDGTAGFAVKDDGDIVSLFNTEGGPHRGVTPGLLSLAVQAGGRKLDDFDIYLTDIYTAQGFRPVARIPWSDEAADPDWDKRVFRKFNNGEPEVWFYVYDPTYNGKIVKKEIPIKDSYDAAVATQERKLQGVLGNE